MIEPWYCIKMVPVNVKKYGTGSGTVTSSPLGINCGPYCSEEFPEGSTVTLTAKAEEGSKFTGWSGGGCASSGTDPCKMTLIFVYPTIYPCICLPPTVSIAATFDLESRPSFDLAASKTGTGTGSVKSSPAGIDCGGTCTAEFEEGKEVTLTQLADAGSEFVKWTGACTGSGSCKVTMSAAKEVTAEFKLKPIVITDFTLKVKKTGTGTGKVTSSPAGIDCGSECEVSYEEGREVTLIASPNAGSAFSSWKGCDVVNGRECKVTVDAAETVSAKFTEVKALSVQKEGAGLGSVKSSPGGISCLAACVSAEAEFSAGPPVKEVTLTAAPYQGSTFAGWNGDCSGLALTCKVTLSAAKSVTAEFAPIPKVSLTLDKPLGAGTVKSAPVSINCAAACSSQTSGFYAGSEVELAETPYKLAFSQWTGSCSGSLPTCKLTMTEAKTVGAEFAGALATDISLTLTKAEGGTGTGKVTSYPSGVNCDASCSSSVAAFKSGAKVILRQTPAKGSTFAGWDGACSGSDTCEVALAEAEEVTAKFEAIPFRTLTVDKAGGGTGTVKSTPAGINCGLTCPRAAAVYPQTDSVTLTATPGRGSGPVQWTGCDEVVGGLCIAAMSSTEEVTAGFE